MVGSIDLIFLCSYSWYTTYGINTVRNGRFYRFNISMLEPMIYVQPMELILLEMVGFIDLVFLCSYPWYTTYGINTVRNGRFYRFNISMLEPMIYNLCN